MNRKIELLRGLQKARKSQCTNEFINKLSEDDYELIKQNITGTTAHIVSSTLVTNLDNDEVLQNTKTFSNKKHFNAYRNWQESLAKLPKKSLDSIDNTTKDIIKLIENRFSSGERCYGLVVGYVQSGKTGHFSGLISRAVDEGFTLIIVLSGILNDLRRQTQLRLHKDVFGSNNIKAHTPFKSIITPENSNFRFLTDINSDIGSGEFTIIDDDMRESLANGEVLVAVTKKNTSVLQHLLNGIGNSNDKIREKHKVLIIDDEADHATVNTGGDGDDQFSDPSLNQTSEDEEDPTDDDSDPSKTNLLVRKIIKQFPKCAYVGYTATPYANVLIDPFLKTEELGLSLYPRDFIMNLVRPDGYFGAERFFGVESNDEGKHVIIHPEETAEEIMKVELNIETNISDVVPNALKLSMMDFILTGVVKHHRRLQGVCINPNHHSMLVHVSRLNKDQSVIHDMTTKLIQKWKVQSESMFEQDELLGMLEERWNQEFVAKHRSIESFSEFSNLIIDEDGWMQDVKVMMINSESDEILDYDAYPNGLNVIAIGGNKLSRGLTLEGLTVSVYMRKTRMYDSLMQMGRWFGYRHGYEDLVRVHTTEHLYSWFEWLVKAENAVRKDIDRYAMLGIDPTEIAVRIPWHDELTPTSRKKMKYAIKNIYNYSNRTTESIHMPIHNSSQLEDNLNSTNQFFKQIGKFTNSTNRGYVWEDVTKNSIIEFLENIELPGPPIATFDTKGLVNFIKKTENLDDFVVAYFGRNWEDVNTTQNYAPAANLPHSMDTKYVGRSQIGIEKSGTGNIRAISDPNDREYVKNLAPNKPALIVYFVAPGSKASNESNTRIDLPEGDVPIVGLALRFPETEGPLSDIRAAITVRGLKGDLIE